MQNRGEYIFFPGWICHSAFSNPSNTVRVTRSFVHVVRFALFACCKQLDRKEQTKLNHIKQTVSLSQHSVPCRVALRRVAKSADKTALCAWHAQNFRPGVAAATSFHCSASYRNTYRVAALATWQRTGFARLSSSHECLCANTQLCNRAPRLAVARTSENNRPPLSITALESIAIISHKTLFVRLRRVRVRSWRAYLHDFQPPPSSAQRG